MRRQEVFPIVAGMKWVLAGLILFVAGAALRRILRMGTRGSRSPQGLVPLSLDCEAVYQPVSQEVEAEAAILAVSLNDAIEERDEGNHEIAWRLVRLAASEWGRLAEILTDLLNVIAKYLADARVAVPVRSIVAHRFKSQAMIDYFRIHELLEQLVFRSKLRFQLQVRALRRATEILTAELRRTYRYAERTGDRPQELWNRLDLYFHDFDLVTKETLLAFRHFLVCLPPSTLASISADLRPIVRRAVRATSVTADR